MKKLLFLIVVATVALQATWSDAKILENGYNKQLLCRSGILIQVLTKTVKGKVSKIEQLVCYNIKAFSGLCRHEPIVCFTPPEHYGTGITRNVIEVR